MSAEILSFGCRLNAFESEVIRQHVDGEGAPASGEALVVVNTCAVTAEAERQARAAIRRIRREQPGARIVVTGCAAQIDPARWAGLEGVARVIGNAEKLRAESWRVDAWGTDGTVPSGDAVDVSGAAGIDVSGASRIDVSDIMVPDADAPPPPVVHEFAGRARAFVQVQGGCDHRCTFCVIPFGRGPSRSVPAGAVVEQVRTLVENGCREVVLTGVDLTSYGPDLPGRPTLGALARRVLRLVPELPRLRISSLDPVEIDEDLWALLAEEERLMPHLHLSLQAANDMVLKRMKRRHDRAGAAAAIRRARALRPGIAIGADLIAGFPTEDEAMFADTRDFVLEHAIPYLHVFPYSERPGTPAARMPAVPVPVRRERAGELRAAGARNALAFHAGFAGAPLSVLVEKPGLGRSAHYAPVRLADGHAPGTVVALRCTGTDRDGLSAD